MANIYKDRITKLRNEMKKQGVDVYYIPTSDYHFSEYIGEYFKVREFLSGFTGSNGTLIVTMQEAGLWTDGRYFVQAEKELEESDIHLFKLGQAGVPTTLDYLKQTMRNGQMLGFDGLVVNAAYGLKLQKELSVKGVNLRYDIDLTATIWEDRPTCRAKCVTILPDTLTGCSTKEKLAKVRAKMEEYHTKEYVLCKLDDIMWLFNMRGNDIPCNPVAYAYAYITMNNAILFLKEDALKNVVCENGRKEGYFIKEYDKFNPFLENLQGQDRLLLDYNSVSFGICKILASKYELINKTNITEQLKCIKNEVELEHLKDIYLKDSAAVTRFLYWIKEESKKEELTESKAADYMYMLRSKIPEFFGLSFETISAYAANAAMMHYKPSKDNPVSCKREGMLLVDSGGQYIGGTTDVTRTIVLGKISAAVKTQFTAVACGMLRLGNAKFLYGCTGRNLDILAREPIWAMNMDYKCGTGHGIGYMLNVHEGPQSIRFHKSIDGVDSVLEAGMIISDEPGVYVEGSHGIRTENILLCEKSTNNEDGQFMKFDWLTYVPIDLDGIDVDYMSEKERSMLNNYHRQVFEKVSPYLNDEEKNWLKSATRAV